MQYRDIGHADMLSIIWTIMSVFLLRDTERHQVDFLNTDIRTIIHLLSATQSHYFTNHLPFPCISVPSAQVHLPTLWRSCIAYVIPQSCLIYLLAVISFNRPSHDHSQLLFVHSFPLLHSRPCFLGTFQQSIPPSVLFSLLFMLSSYLLILSISLLHVVRLSLALSLSSSFSLTLRQRHLLSSTSRACSLSHISVMAQNHQVVSRTHVASYTEDIF